MDNDRLLSGLNRIPVIPMLIAFLGYYVGYDYYGFTESASSPKLQKKGQIIAAREEQKKIEEKIRQAQEFLKSLEAKKSEIQALAQELNSMKASMSETFDVPEFMKMIITEARKVGLSVLGLKPTSQGKKEFYGENAFELSFRGAYVQVLVFLDRLAQSQKVIRTEHLTLKPKGSAYARYVELEGSVQINGFYYLGSKADEIATPVAETHPGVGAGTGAGSGSGPGAGTPAGGGGP